MSQKHSTWLTRKQRGKQLRTTSVVLNFSCTRTFSLFLFLNTCRADGVMRTMVPEKLLKSMPILQGQIDALLEFDVRISLAGVSPTVRIVFHWRWAAGKAGSRLRSPSFTLARPFVEAVSAMEMIVQIVPAVYQVFPTSWENVRDAFLEPQVWRRMAVSCCLWQNVVQNVPAGSWLRLLLEATLYRPSKWHTHQRELSLFCPGPSSWLFSETIPMYWLW